MAGHATVRDKGSHPFFRRSKYQVKSISHIYREAHAVSHTSSRMKADKSVNTALDSRLQQESQWVRKGSVSVYSENHYQNAIEECNIQNSQISNPLENIKKKVKNNINEEFRNHWNEHIKTLTVQASSLIFLMWGIVT